MLQRKCLTSITKRLLSTTKNDFQLSTLSNGLRVATSNVPGHFSALGVYINSGSRYETGNLRGCSHILDRMAFKSTEHIDGRTMNETLESLGGNYQATSARETMMYQASVFNNDVEKMLHLISETVRFPKLTEDELQDQKISTQYEIDGIWLKPESILPELLHTTAYSGETLGSPLICPRELVPSITKSSLNEYRNKFYTPQNTVAAFVGVNHDDAVKMTDKYFGDWQKTHSTMTKTPSHYTGGETSIPPGPVFGNLPELYHIQIAFEGLPIDHPDIYALATLQTLLGGGGSFSAGGPGKGMFSRLYTHVLNQFYFVENCVAFNHPYSDSGLFGISISCTPENAYYAAEIIGFQFASCFLEGNAEVKVEEVERAKNQLKSSLLMNLESKLVELEDMGRHVQVHGRKIPINEMINKIEALTIHDIRRVAKLVFTGGVKNAGKGTGKPTVVIQGKREAFGNIDDVLKRFGLGNYSTSNSYQKLN